MADIFVTATVDRVPILSVRHVFDADNCCGAERLTTACCVCLLAGFVGNNSAVFAGRVSMPSHGL